jgi:bifunctional non-homologous end joining protein LigD
VAAGRIPFRVAPMLATLVDEPFHSPGWVYEEKYDGFRFLAYKEGKTVTLLTRNMKDRTGEFSAVAAAIARLPAPTLVLDGEVVVLDARGVSRFQYLQRRMLGEAVSPPVFAVFDCLYARGRDLRARPLAERREVVEREVREGPVLIVAKRLAADGFKAFQIAQRRGLEGVIAKDGASAYVAGTRSPLWRKVKVRAEEEFVIGGYTAPRGSRSHFGSLLLGAWADDRLQYAGKVGTGFNARLLDDLMRRFRALVRPTSPFVNAPRERGVTWLEPKLVAQIGFTERTSDGKLRHPTFLGLRDDKPAHQVLWPSQPGRR